MKRSTTLFSFLFFCLIHSLSFGLNTSSIDFVKLEARSSDKVIHFKWDVNSETQGDHFFIEKSIDGTNWERITQVTSLGNHETPHTYMVSEINQAEGQQELFRIQRVDKFGHSAVMDRVNIEHIALINLYLIPSTKPSKGHMIVSYNSLVNSSGSIQVLDAGGNLIEQLNVDISRGYNRVSVETSHYEKGRYSVVLADEFNNTLKKEYAHGRKAGRTKF